MKKSTKQNLQSAFY